MMKPVSFIVALVILFTSLMYGFPVSAQETPQDQAASQNECTESELRSQGVAMLSCNPPGNQCSAGASVIDTTIEAFARSTIDSAWGISDATVEQWFLKQAGASRVKNRYGLNESNIGDITVAVKGVGVSPVFFYAYTVNEGGGAGGFINHYRGEASGGGVGNAVRDANYLFSASQNSDSSPSWIDAGNPVDFVPQSVKEAGDADFQNMPLGTIGRAYIPATAATTWEVYYPDGLKKEFNRVQNYGSPLTDMINNINGMGGNPSQGDSVESGSCADGSTLTGEGVTKAVEWAKTIANNDGYGYDQPTRQSGWQKWQEDPDCTNGCGSFDCSSFVAGAYTEAGYFDANPQFSTGNMVSVLSKNGFTKIADSAATENNLQPGDILIDDSHTAMYIGGGQIVHASKNENGGTSGGQTGDQTGKEIRTASLYKTNWSQGIWRVAN